MATNSFGNKKFHATNEKAHHALMRGPVFFLWGGGKEGGMDFFGGDFSLFSWGFQNGSSSSPTCSPRCSLNYLRFIPYGFAQSSTPMYIN